MKKKLISILGSTGSIGSTALNIVDSKSSFFKINLLSANKNYNLICKQIKKYKPVIFVITNPLIYEKIKKKFNNRNIKLFNNFDFINFKKKI